MVGGTVIVRNWKVTRQASVVGAHRRDGQCRPNRRSARALNSKWIVPTIRIAGSRMIGGAEKKKTAIPTRMHVTVLTTRGLS